MPSKVTAVPTVTFWLEPALAIGSALAVDTLTVVATAGLSTLPSFTMREATKVPATSALNVGFDVVMEDNTAELPVGLVMSAHL